MDFAKAKNITLMSRDNRRYASRGNDSCNEFCRRLYPDLLPTDSPGNRITSAASARRNLELRNTETCGKYRRDINQDLLETFFFSSLFHIRQ